MCRVERLGEEIGKIVSSSAKFPKDNSQKLFTRAAVGAEREDDTEDEKDSVDNNINALHMNNVRYPIEAMSLVGTEL